MASTSRRKSASSASTKKTPQPRKPRKRADKTPKIKAKTTSVSSVRSTASTRTLKTSRSKPRQSQSFAGSQARSGRNAVAHDPLRSVSVSQVRDAARYRKKRASSRVRIIGGVVIVLMVALAVGFFALYSSNVFAITKVTVSGVSHLTAEEMTELAAVPQDSTLIRVDAGGIEQRLESNPWVQSASVERVFPDALNLNITEREIAALVYVQVDTQQTTETWALSADGMWLMEIPDPASEEGQAIASQVYEDVNNALVISDVPYGSEPEAGTLCTNANITNALGIIDGMTTELGEQVRRVSASSNESTTLILESGVEIAFGDSSNIREKERVCLQLIQDNPGQIAYINVRTPDRPIWRSL